ncbi:ATP-grasp domain-containing protein [Rothia nasimurium]|uniref:ATP-grasp domain-containing protein n=1 Tax=Rothia nasimurium TaxID=85336 RepID=A0A4Y9F394_9MICC|nr:biotin carboxylase N-terminal domain-containing protein [Rothia nasimurium]MBF0808227.1 ATP-grasp domain-containing protein [Rothia nasimurium]TFU22297.1 ATP-grasp domain-containing protein [Rothia nasimurium]
MRKVLVANRGEIAVRIIGACAAQGIASVAVYADSDAEALHTALADEAYALEGTGPAETYLDMEKVLAIAVASGATDVHPGYGFLAENADFARAVMAAGLTWIGPAPETIEALGDKVKARELAQSVGAPLAPGSDGPVASPEEARAFAQEHGLPSIIKAAHGGGGRGMRIVRELGEVEDAFVSASREAVAAFGNGECFIERFLEKPRHVEAQVAADSHGNVVVVGTRDCSLQRRNQKLVEEAPAPFLTAEQRAQIERASAEIFQAAGYVGVGTAEFMVALDGTISFLEVNTRIQVEHPVTEEVTGVNLVALQLDIAAGKPLPFTGTPEPVGHAFEFRINAEDPARGFLPAAGRIESITVPSGPGIRWDAGVRPGSVVSGEFDSMLAKLIVTGPTREVALRRARFALAQMDIAGVATVLPFDRQVLEAPAFTAESGDFEVYTTWIEDALLLSLTQGDGATTTPASAEAGSGVQASYRQPLLPVGASVFPGTGITRFTLEIDGTPHRVGLPDSVFASLGSGTNAATPASGQGQTGAGQVLAPMGGALLKYTVAVGDEVAAGDQVALLEAMKTEVPVLAETAGTVAELPAQAGERLTAGQVLVVFE